MARAPIVTDFVGVQITCASQRTAAVGLADAVSAAAADHADKGDADGRAVDVAAGVQRGEISRDVTHVVVPLGTELIEQRAGV